MCLHCLESHRTVEHIVLRCPATEMHRQELYTRILLDRSTTSDDPLSMAEILSRPAHVLTFLHSTGEFGDQPLRHYVQGQHPFRWTAEDAAAYLERWRSDSSESDHGFV